MAVSLLALACPAFSQELYVNTEPASNMATNSLGIRVENQGYFNPYKTRTTLELMYGASRHLMIHGSLYLSDYYEPQTHFWKAAAFTPNTGFYPSIRFKSILRGAVFAKVSSINNPIPYQEIALDGDNSGLQSGVVFTQLLHKLALSGSASYLHAWDNAGGFNLPSWHAENAVAYTLSAGYLLLPKTYTNYSQTNLNIYAELLGKTNPGYGQSYLDAAPAVQLIFNSLIRVDFSYRIPLYSSMERNTAHVYLVRVEYNLFNL